MQFDPGTYPVQLLGAALGETSKGDPIISVQVRHVAPSPYAGHADAWDGWLNNDKAFETTGKTLRECLWTGDDIENVTFPADTIAQAVYQAGNDGVVRLKYLNGPGRAPRNKPLADDKKADVKARMRAALQGLGSTTSAPAVPEKLRPFLAAAAGVTDAQSGARLWKQFAQQRVSWSPDEAKTAWAALCTRVPAAEVTAILKAPAAPVIVPKVEAQDDRPPF